MRQGHQNRRGRNRNNNSGGARKGQNPVTRSYESNGPDMKIRGTPAHIAEKYIALSRDAQTNGDPVLAENFLQHAEHYNRIILAYRDAQSQQPHDQPSNSPPNGNAQQRNPANQEQPFVGDNETDPGKVAQPDSNGQSQNRRQQRGRPQRQSRTRKPRPASGSSEAQAGGDDAQRRGDQGGVPEHEQPEFLRRSIRRPRRDSEQTDSEAVAADDAAQD